MLLVRIFDHHLKIILGSLLVLNSRIHLIRQPQVCRHVSDCDWRGRSDSAVQANPRRPRGAVQADFRGDAASGLRSRNVDEFSVGNYEGAGDERWGKWSCVFGGSNCRLSCDGDAWSDALRGKSSGRDRKFCFDRFLAIEMQRGTLAWNPHTFTGSLPTPSEPHQIDLGIVKP